MIQNNNYVMFHYTQGRNWRTMNEGFRGLIYDPAVGRYVSDVNHKGLKGLFPQTMLIPWSEGVRNLPEEAYAHYSCGLFAPKPIEWIQNPEFPEVWNRLFKHILFSDMMNCDDSLVLLKIDISNIVNDSAPWVLDWGIVERALKQEEIRGEKKEQNKNYIAGIVRRVNTLFNKCEPKIDQHSVRPKILKAYDDYWNSRVPLVKYDGSYSLPEIVVKDSISLENITFVLEKKLDSDRDLNKVLSELNQATL
jgi:hypothetical protein